MKKIIFSALPISRPNCKPFFRFLGTAQTPTKTSNPKPQSLYKRISPIGNPRISILPVLDQWVSEGRNIGAEELRGIIRELKKYNRYIHALEISLWMTDKKHISQCAGDVAIRIHLIYKVHGLEQVETYFNSVSHRLKKFNVYAALLNCYYKDKAIEKAEGIVEKLRELGNINSTVNYNVLLNLYNQTGNWKKLDILMHEMEEKGIPFDSHTYSIRLHAYAAASDSEGIDKLLTRIESDSQVIVQPDIYTIAANGFLKAGLEDKVILMLKKLEEHSKTVNKNNVEYDVLLTLYGKLGKKDELYRIWNLLKEGKISNKRYMKMLSVLLKLNDIEGAEQIFQEWEERVVTYDFRIPKIVIKIYCRNKRLEKAETLLKGITEKGRIPTSDTWCYMADAYIASNQLQEAAEAIKKAISMCQPEEKRSKERLVSCLEHLENGGNAERAVDEVKSFCHDKLASFINEARESDSKDFGVYL